MEFVDTQAYDISVDVFMKSPCFFALLEKKFMGVVNAEKNDRNEGAVIELEVVLGFSVSLGPRIM